MNCDNWLDPKNSRIAAMTHFHPGGGAADLHTGLLDLGKPGSRFVAHLFTVADNAQPHGLDEPYLTPLAECLAEYKPLVRVMYGDKKADAKPTPTPTPAAGKQPTLVAAVTPPLREQHEGDTTTPTETSGSTEQASGALPGQTVPPAAQPTPVPSPQPQPTPSAPTTQSSPPDPLCRQEQRP